MTSILAREEMMMPVEKLSRECGMLIFRLTESFPNTEAALEEKNSTIAETILRAPIPIATRLCALIRPGTAWKAVRELVRALSTRVFGEKSCEFTQRQLLYVCMSVHDVTERMGPYWWLCDDDGEEDEYTENECEEVVSILNQNRRHKQTADCCLQYDAIMFLASSCGTAALHLMAMTNNLSMFVASAITGGFQGIETMTKAQRRALAMQDWVSDTVTGSREWQERRRNIAAACGVAICAMDMQYMRPEFLMACATDLDPYEVRTFVQHNFRKLREEQPVALRALLVRAFRDKNHKQQTLFLRTMIVNPEFAEDIARAAFFHSPFGRSLFTDIIQTDLCGEYKTGVCALLFNKGAKTIDIAENIVREIEGCNQMLAAEILADFIAQDTDADIARLCMDGSGIILSELWDHLRIEKLDSSLLKQMMMHKYATRIFIAKCLCFMHGGIDGFLLDDISNDEIDKFVYALLPYCNFSTLTRIAARAPNIFCGKIQYAIQRIMLRSGSKIPVIDEILQYIDTPDCDAIAITVKRMLMHSPSSPYRRGVPIAKWEDEFSDPAAKALLIIIANVHEFIVSDSHDLFIDALLGKIDMSI